MRFFTYGRKSVYKDSSDSIDNQMRMCREYCEARFSGEIDSWQQFSDEDFTGANTNRPGFQQMMELIRDDMCDVLVVYQLDRFSRDVRDFSQAYKEMQEHNVRFICLDLNIDTSTPIGEAMMYVSAAFGQMERKNIALRVTDNLNGLAKKGYWVAGNPPIGYERQQITVDGRKHVTIVPVPDQVEYVNWLFDYFLSDNYSLYDLEVIFKKQKIKTVNGFNFSMTQIYKMLTSPYCVEATPEVYDYYAAKGCQMESPRELWDGTHGVMVLGRTTEVTGKHRNAPPEKWIVCLGYHEPFMPAEKWLEVQRRFTHNKSFHDPKYPIAFLRGVIRCSCGAMMGVSTKKKPKGGYSRWYYCQRRMRWGVEECPRRQIKTDFIDDKVMEVFNEIKADPDMIYKYVQQTEKKTTEDPKKLIKKISGVEDKIKRLASSLTLAENSTATKYIIAEMEELDKELQALKIKKSDMDIELKRNAAQKKDATSKVEEITRLMDGLEGFSAEERNEIAKSIIKKCTWDGETLFISL